MKITLQSLLTAAVFASSLGTGLSDTFAVQANNDDITQVPQPTYGPPVFTQTETDDLCCKTTSRIVYGTTVTTPTTTTSTSDRYPDFTGTVTMPTTTTTTTTTSRYPEFIGTVTTPTTTTTPSRYPEFIGTVTTPTTTTITSRYPEFIGTVTTPTTTTVPTTTEFAGATHPITMPHFSPADVNADEIIDARDVSMLKRDILNGNSFYGNDINQDGVINKEDVKALIRLLTGKPEDEDEPITTDITNQNNPAVTSVTTTAEFIQTSYGPPPAWK